MSDYEYYVREIMPEYYGRHQGVLVDTLLKAGQR